MHHEPLHTGFDLHVEVIAVRRIVVWREHIRKNVLVHCVANERPEFFGFGYRRNGRIGTTRFFADFPMKMRSHVDPRAVFFA